jgi:hypothetical protein
MTVADSIKELNNLTNQNLLTREDSMQIKWQKTKQRLRLKYKDIKFIPIYNNRLSLVGTFCDSAQLDTLKESYISQLSHKETCNDYNIINLKLPDVIRENEEFYDVEYINDTLISLICNAKPRLMLKSKNPYIKTLFLNDKEECQVTGISYLINIGDINSDNKDEIAVVCSTIKFAGATSTCKIFSYESSKWKELFSFIIYEIPYEKKNATNKISGFLEKKNCKWYYRDYNWQGLDSERRLLKIK